MPDPAPWELPRGVADVGVHHTHPRKVHPERTKQRVSSPFCALGGEGVRIVIHTLDRAVPLFVVVKHVLKQD